MFWQKNKTKIIVAIIILAVLAVAFWWGGNAPGLQGWPTGGTQQGQSDVVPPTNGSTDDVQTGDDPAENNSTEPDTPAQDPTEQPPADDEKEDENRPAPQERPGGDKTGSLTAAEKEQLAANMGGGEKANGDEQYSEEQGMQIDEKTGKDKYLTDPVPEGKPIPVEPENAVISDKELSCTMSISCATILENMSWLDPEKVELVPEDGWILKPTTVTFYEGESVFNLLRRVCKQQGIHMEFVNTPMYNSAYIEGINNLYEFDCGDLSGWMYSVNGWFPNYGCSRYQLKAGDNVEWQYTCTLGNDVNGGSSLGGQ